MIPLVHDFTDRTVLVFGGGRVGERKVRRFADEARVVVVSPAFTDGLTTMAGESEVGEATPETWEPSEETAVELVSHAPTPAEVGDWVDRVEPALVVAATDAADVNEAAAAAARERGVLVNRTDEAGERDAGSVVVPATVDDGPVSVAITTGGSSPALSKYLRERLEEELAGAGAMAELTRELRAELKAGEYTPTERRDAVRRVVRSSRVWKALHTPNSNPRRVAEDVIRTETTQRSGLSGREEEER
jgi:precorrin-2 dehydrogenase/sirohydrochlorin ferrochelatase